MSNESSLINASSSENIDNESDEDLLELNLKFKKNTQSRRCSVFSKSCDPDQESDSQTSSSFDDSNHSYEIIKNRPFEKEHTHKTPEQLRQLKSQLKSIVIFKYLDNDELELIIDSMFEKTCEKDELIICEGDTGYYFYVVIRGVFQVFLKDSNSPDDEGYGKRHKDYNGTGFFGELSLLYDTVSC